METPNKETKLSVAIVAEMAGWSVERVLRQKLGTSRGLLRNAKRRQAIYLDGDPVKTITRVKEGQLLELALDRQESTVIPERMDLQYLYQDEALVALAKPPGMLVHPLSFETTGTLANGVVYDWLQQGVQDKFRPVHRLDRDTSGIVLVAKNAYVHQQIQLELQQDQVKRCYLALVQGRVDQTRGTIDAPIGLAEGSFIKRVISPLGKAARSDYVVLRQFARGALVWVKLHTGRTHQVRVHLAHLGHPLFGDDLYGGDTVQIKRQALHCAYLAFTHPLGGNELVLTCPLPEDMRLLMKKLDQESP